MARVALAPDMGEMMAAVQDGDPLALARRLRSPVWVYDIDARRIPYANAAACALWNAVTEAELAQRDMSLDLSTTVAKRLRQYQADFIAHDAVFNEMWTLYPNNVPVSVMVFFSGFQMPDGRTAMLCEVAGEADNQPENLRSAEALLHTDVMITLYSLDGGALYMNPAARNANVSPDHTLHDMFIRPEDFEQLTSEVDQNGEYRCVAEVNTSQGQRWHDVSAKACSDAVTGQNALLVTAIDVSDLKTARDKARYLADRDQLTGCFNRAYLQRYMDKIAQEDGPTDYAVAYFDVDRFKQINDLFGHEMGDVVLKQLAARVLFGIDQNELLVRLGGDEFVVLLRGITGPDALMARVEKLRRSLSQPIVQDSWRLDVTVSIGATLVSPSEVPFTEVMRQADIALYASKMGGRNRSTLFDQAMGAAAQERDQIEYDLKRALKTRDFILHYQPRVDLRSGKVVSVEGLVRWKHPTRGLMPPDSFIPICEETGMIEELGRQVLDLGSEQAAIWQDMGLDIGLSLNISPRQFGDPALMPALEQFAAAPGFRHGKIELEVTENVLIGDPDEIAAKLRTIHDMGYRIAIDDFGAGYSNLSYITRFPLNCIKIDKSFIASLPCSAPVVTLILTLARQTGLTSVAEGVETEEQLAFLREHGCDQVQGYLFSRPVPAKDLPPLLSKTCERGRA